MPNLGGQKKNLRLRLQPTRNVQKEGLEIQSREGDPLRVTSTSLSLSPVSVAGLAGIHKNAGTAEEAGGRGGNGLSLSPSTFGLRLKGGGAPKSLSSLEVRPRQTRPSLLKFFSGLRQSNLNPWRPKKRGRNKSSRQRIDLRPKGSVKAEKSSHGNPG